MIIMIFCRGIPTVYFFVSRDRRLGSSRERQEAVRGGCSTGNVIAPLVRIKWFRLETSN